MKFLFYFVVVFVLSFVLLYSAGLTPSALKTEKSESLRTLWDKTQTQAINDQLRQPNRVETPTRIVISKIGVDAVVANPNTTEVATLDDYLLRGAVRYPGSGSLGFGNMFIFGHSTGLAVVHNQAYKTFNGLKDLTTGDTIKVYGGSKIYTYKVRTVTLVDKDQALVEFGNQKNMLTLSTCNTFGQKGERYVVEADYVGTL